MILDLFAGVGGWEEALRLLGHEEPSLGLEIVPESCKVAEEAGHPRMAVDVTTVEPRKVVHGPVSLLLGAPPCQTFSSAGQGTGRGGYSHLTRALDLVAMGVPVATALETVGADGNDPRTSLTLQPMRFIRELRPGAIAFEEVKEVLPIWEAYAEVLRDDLGYHVWTGVLNAADYGLPQTRRRAFLLARQGKPITRPVPTHSKGGDWGLFDSREPWVTMAQALGWDETDCIEANALAPEEARDPEACLWPLHRPATTIVRSFRPDVVAAPGYRQKGDPSRQNALGSVVIDMDELKILQGVRSDFPIEIAPPGKQRSLLGGILPPSWAAKILNHLLDERPQHV
jgi:site-specific DNA-cytosine methylase